MNNEKELREFVNREVFANVSHLVSELASQDKYMDDLLPILIDYSEDEENPTEALEHYIVSDWLADKLIAQGEMVTKDFLNLTIWGRTCSGQAIICDSVIQYIYEGLGA